MKHLFLFILTGAIITCNAHIFTSLEFRSKDYNKILHFNNLAENYLNNNQTDSALYFYEQSYLLAKENNLHEEMCFTLKQAGIICEINGNYSKSLEYLFKADEIAEKNNLTQLKASILINIGIVYFNLQKPDEAINNYNQALEISKITTDTILMIKALNNLGNAYMTLLHDWNKSENYFQKSIELAEKVGFDDAVMVGLNNLCQIYMNSNRNELASETAIKMLEHYPENPYIYYNLANLYNQNNETIKAIEFYQKALALASIEPELKQVLLKDLSQIESENGNFEKSLYYYQEYSILRDSLHSLEQTKYILELETKYQTLKKEKEITELKNDSLKAKRINNLYFFSIIILLLITAFLIFIINYRKTLTKHKISQLENEKTIIATNAALEGEEKERERIARELHDGLGGLLSAAKLNLENNEPNDKIKDTIGISITELKRISNALLPETLLKMGLANAICSFSKAFSGYTNIEIECSTYGSDNRYNSVFELSVYRITQETINNAIKHAKCSLVTIEIIQDASRLFISIADDGIGFDPNLLKNNKGMGIQNIKKRVEVYSGRVEFNNRKPHGTEIIIEFTNTNDNLIKL